MQRDEEVVDEFHLGRSAEITEMKTGLGKRGHDGFHFLNRLRGATQVNDAFALHHHAGSAADLAVQKRDVLGRKWCDILLFDRHRMRAEFHHNLARTCRFKKTAAAAHDLVEGLVIKDGPHVEVLNAVSLHGGLPASWPFESPVTSERTVAALVAHWREVGLPDYAQFDNDMIFHGTHRYPDALGRVLRLCLSLGVVPVLVPPRETGFSTWRAETRYFAQS